MLIVVLNKKTFLGSIENKFTTQRISYHANESMLGRSDIANVHSKHAQGVDAFINSCGVET